MVTAKVLTMLEDSAVSLNADLPSAVSSAGLSQHSSSLGLKDLKDGSHHSAIHTDGRAIRRRGERTAQIHDHVRDFINRLKSF